MIPFHLAFPVTDLEKTRQFYVDLLGCKPGRSSERWLDFDFFGHQISAHLVDRMDREVSNEVDGQAVPSRHFGAVLDWQSWEALADKLEKHGISFLVSPCVRFRGAAGEQGTFFVRDPSGNALEFKSFRDPGKLFAE